MGEVDLRHERQLLQQSLSELLGHRSGESDEAIGFEMPAALASLLIRRRFSGVDIRDVTAYVAGVLERFELENSHRHARAAEMLIRGELGEFDVVEPGLVSEDEFSEVIWMLMGDLAIEADLRPDMLDSLLDQAVAECDRFLIHMRDNDLTPDGAFARASHRWAGGLG